MTQSQFRNSRFGLASFNLLVVVYALISRELAWIWLSLVISLPLHSLLKLTVRPALADERRQLVEAKAAQLSFKVFLPILFLTSLSLIVAAQKPEYYYLQALAVVFSYITLLCTAIYAISYLYHDKQTGG